MVGKKCNPALFKVQLVLQVAGLICGVRAREQHLSLATVPAGRLALLAMVFGWGALFFLAKQCKVHLSCATFFYRYLGLDN
jgi:hypothetical protein